MKFFIVLACCIVGILIYSAATNAASISGQQESVPASDEDAQPSEAPGSAGGDPPRKPFMPEPRTFFALFPLLFPDLFNF